MPKEELYPLFITYDGLLDALGGSQILPYIKGIAAKQGGMVVLSFEKSNRLEHGQSAMTLELQRFAIHWKPLRFTSGFGVLGKLWDMTRMYYWCAWLSFKHNVDVVHARGHPTAQIGLFVKRLLGSKLIFDCRGLWVDERVDKGGWDMARPLHRMQFHYFKRMERKLFTHADQVVVLTEKVVEEIVRLGATPSNKVTVIPCCADFNHFPLATAELKSKARAAAGIPHGARVLGYLGSVGRMYLLERFFYMFELAAKVHMDLHAFLITQDVEALRQIMRKSLSPALYDRVHVRSASRDEVPELLPALDLLVNFVLPSYARISMSPTKLAECFAEGIPVICNEGVGDVEQNVKKLGAGYVVTSVSDEGLANVILKLDEIFAMGGQRLRDAARPFLGLELAQKRYQYVYSKLS